MALNTKKIERRKNNADKMLQQLESQQPDNSAISTIESLETSAQNSSLQKIKPTENKNNETEHHNLTPDGPILDSKGNPDRGFGLNKDGTFRQSKAGRKKKNAEDKKEQIVLTIAPQTSAKLTEWATKRPRSATNYLSMYVDDHIDEILEYFENK